MSWQERIELAKANGSFTTYDLARATGWVTCACAEQDPRIPRSPGGAPLDPNLRHLGGLFAGAVATNLLRLAEKVLKQIEDRAAEIMKEAQ